MNQSTSQNFQVFTEYSLNSIYNEYISHLLQSRGAARCANTAYGSKIWDTSGVRTALTWPMPAEPADESSPRTAFLQRKKSTYYHLNKEAWTERPATAPEASVTQGSNDSGSGSGIALAVVSRQMVFRTTTPRFAARAALEQRRAETPNFGAEKNRARLQYHDARRFSQQAKQEKVQILEEEWPHGMPVRTNLIPIVYSSDVVL